MSQLTRGQVLDIRAAHDVGVTIREIARRLRPIGELHFRRGEPSNVPKRQTRRGSSSTSAGRRGRFEGAEVRNAVQESGADGGPHAIGGAQEEEEMKHIHESLSEAATELGVSRTHLSKLVDQGELPAERVGGQPGQPRMRVLHVDVAEALTRTPEGLKVHTQCPWQPVCLSERPGCGAVKSWKPSWRRFVIGPDSNWRQCGLNGTRQYRTLRSCTVS